MSEKLSRQIVAFNPFAPPPGCAWCGVVPKSACTCGAQQAVFVFGSNEAGLHGAGAAAYAVEECGAIYGVGEGMQGWSYAIPTKDHDVETLELDEIQYYVNNFLLFAAAHPEMTFAVTRIGCGLAGLKDSQVAPMFLGYPDNCFMPPEWKPYLPPRSP